MVKNIRLSSALILLTLIIPLRATIIFNEDDAVPEFPHGSLAIFYTYANIIGAVENDEIVRFEPNHHLVNHGFTGEWVQGLGKGFFGRIDVPVVMEFDEINGQSERITSWGDPIISSKWVYLEWRKVPVRHCGLVPAYPSAFPIPWVFHLRLPSWWVG